MAKYYVMGNYTAQAFKGFLKDPKQDRAAAATALVQRTIREKVEKEIEEGKDALNVTPNLIQNFNKFVTDTRNKLKKIKAEQEKKKALREQRKRKLNS